MQGLRPADVADPEAQDSRAEEAGAGGPEESHGRPETGALARQRTFLNQAAAQRPGMDCCAVLLGLENYLSLDQILSFVRCESVPDRISAIWYFCSRVMSVVFR